MDPRRMFREAHSSDDEDATEIPYDDLQPLDASEWIKVFEHAIEILRNDLDRRSRQHHTEPPERDEKPESEPDP